MTPEAIASTLPFACLLTALFRARWVALALAPPCMLILARLSGLVDISSASHPLRFLVPIASMSLAMLAAWIYRKILASYAEHGALMVALINEEALRRAKYGAQRALIASILVFASGCADIPALLAWRIPGEWVLVPVQIAICATILVVLLAPERWVIRWMRT